MTPQQSSFSPLLCALCAFKGNHKGSAWAAPDELVSYNMSTEPAALATLLCTSNSPWILAVQKGGCVWVVTLVAEQAAHPSAPCGQRVIRIIRGKSMTKEEEKKSQACAGQVSK